MNSLITYSGKALLLSYILSGAVPVLYVGWGTGAGIIAPTDTALFTEDSGGSPAYARTLTTLSLSTVNTTNDTLNITGSLQANSSKTITNAGIFDKATNGNLLFIAQFSSSLNGGDTLNLPFTWTIS